MTNFKQPLDYVEDHPVVREARKRSLEQLYRRGRGCGNGAPWGQFWIEDCAACRGEGREIRYLLWVFPVDVGACDTCEGMGRVICGESDDYAGPDYPGVHGYDAEHEMQQESGRLNRRG